MTLLTRRHDPISLLNLALLAAGLAAAIASPAARAQTPPPVTAGPYVGASLGWGITTFKNDDFSPAALAGSAGLPAIAVTGSDSPNTFAYKLNAGYRFNDWLGAEIGFVDLGKAKYDYRVPALGLDANVRYRTRAVTLAGVATMPVTADIALFGKLGVAFTEARNEVALSAAGLRDSDTTKKRKNNLYAGAGAEYRLTSNVSMVGEYEYFGTVGDADNTGRARAQLVSLGVRYAF